MGQLRIEIDQSYDLGLGLGMEGVDAVVVLEQLEDDVILHYSVSDSVDYQWFYLLPDSIAVEKSRLERDTLLSVRADKEGTYQLKMPDTSLYFAVVDFSKYQVDLDTVWVDDAGDSCQTLRLYAKLKERSPIFVYSSVADSSFVLPSPNTLFKWENVSDAEAIPLEQSAPYQDTLYTCSPYSEDFFADNALAVKYATPDTMSAEVYEAKAVYVGELEASIADEDGLSNKLKNSRVTEGSAPLDVTYTISPSASINYSYWWIWDQDEAQPNGAIYRFEEQVTHSFVKYVPNGYRIKVEVGNDYCIATDSTEVKVYESGLEAPNIMVLSGAYGKYKLAYQSIDPETFRATIYDRWGRRIYQWTDPDGGWDGRSPVTQSFVSPGVYYCAVKARGTDGKKHDDLFEITAIKGK